MRSATLIERHWKDVAPRRGLRPGDQLLEVGREPPLGAHLVTLRQGYMHHGIYVGLGCVVHYGGLSRGFRRGPVEEAPLSRFSLGRPIWVRTDELGWEDRPEVVRRARSRLGEDSYHVLKNNCEHFCEWAVQCRARSYQVDEFLGRLRRAWQRLGEAPARFLRELIRHTRRQAASPGVSRTWLTTEHMPHPPQACSVPWLAGRDATRQRFTQLEDA